MSALEFTRGLDNRIAAWALTNTRSPTTAKPDVHVANAVIGSEVYGFPPKAEQKTRPIPLGTAVKNNENLLDSNDDRMNQVVYSNGRLWGGLNTAVKTSNYHTTTGIAYFVVSPSVTDATVSSTVTRQGYVAATAQSTLFPAIGVTPSGSAVMTFSLTGTGFFPSAAIMHLNSSAAFTSGIQRLADGVVAAGLPRRSSASGSRLR